MNYGVNQSVLRYAARYTFTGCFGCNFEYVFGLLDEMRWPADGAVSVLPSARAWCQFSDPGEMKLAWLGLKKRPWNQVHAAAGATSDCAIKQPVSIVSINTDSKDHL